MVRPRVRGGVLWILLVATLLSGIVALNLAVLRLNLQAEQLGEEESRLREARAELTSRLSRAGAAGRIETVATQRLGLLTPVETTYLRLEPTKR